MAPAMMMQPRSRHAAGAGTALPARRATVNGDPGLGNQARLRRLSATPVRPQAKLEIGPADDPLEHEADRVAEQVMRTPGPGPAISAAPPLLARKCAACEEEGAAVQMKPAGAAAADGMAAPASVHAALQRPGQPLDAASRAFFEPRFGCAFGHVRVHTDVAANTSAAAVQARAYTAGRDIVFARGQFAPHSPAGASLLAHELAHVVQQAGGNGPLPLQRQGAETPPQVPASAVIRDAPNAKTWAGAPAHCGPNFCRPLPSAGMAIDSRQDLWPIFMVGIAVAVSRRVLPLWSQWAFGGSSSVIDITKDFGGDFTTSPTTAATTAFLVSEITAKLAASPPALTGGSAKVDIATLVPAAVKAIDDPASTNQMNFNVIGDIPGNLAGGIGKDEAANPVGAQPSPQDDARIVKGDVTVIDAGPNLMVVPNLSYTVKDTVDLCPGDCGAPKEQTATIPMSQWEATGISGDVPFTVEFPALALPFTVPKPGAPAAPAPPAPAPPSPAPPKAP